MGISTVILTPRSRSWVLKYVKRKVTAISAEKTANFNDRFGLIFVDYFYPSQRLVRLGRRILRSTHRWRTLWLQIPLVVWLRYPGLPPRVLQAYRVVWPLGRSQL